MGTSTKSKTPLIHRQVATVSLKLYNKKLNNAGYQNHEHLTGTPVVFSPTNGVSSKSLGEAHRALEMKKKEEGFERYHLSTDELISGIRNLTEFLYNYKDC